MPAELPEVSLAIPEVNLVYLIACFEAQPAEPRVIATPPPDIWFQAPMLPADSEITVREDGERFHFDYGPPTKKWSNFDRVTWIGRNLVLLPNRGTLEVVTPAHRWRGTIADRRWQIAVDPDALALAREAAKGDALTVSADRVEAIGARAKATLGAKLRRNPLQFADGKLTLAKRDPGLLREVAAIAHALARS